MTLVFIVYINYVSFKYSNYYINCFRCVSKVYYNQMSFIEIDYE